MKKIWIATTLVFLITGSLQAQTTENKVTAKQQKGMHDRKGKHHLKLSESQQAQLKSIHENYQTRIAKLREDKSISAADLKTKTAELKKEQREKAQSILTTDQKSQIANNKDGKEGMRNGRRNGGAEKWQSKMNLTQEQSARLKESRTAMQSKIKAIKSDNTLTDEQKKEQVKALSKQQKESLKSILTPEQMEKMKNDRKGSKSGNGK